MENEMQFIRQDLMKLRKDVELIKKILMSQRKIEEGEGVLTDWARKELEDARKAPESQYASLEEVKKRVLKK